MSNRFSVFIKKKFFAKGRNLVSVEEPFSLMPKLLKNCKVNGIIDAGASNGRISRTLSRSVAMVYTEVCFNQMYEEGAVFGQIDLFLREYGFELYDFYGPKYSPNGILLWANAIFINRGRIEG